MSKQSFASEVIGKSPARITSNFGYRTDPITGQADTFHSGIDLVSTISNPCRILAFADGVVTVVAYDSGAGNNISIKHSDTVTTRYFHLANGSIDVKVGDSVKAQQEIATMGTTGRSTGNHLHFEYRVNGSATDPKPYLDGTYSIEVDTPKVDEDKGYFLFTTTKEMYTLWSIASKYLGNGNRYKEIEQLNGVNHMNIKIGQVLKIPTAGATNIPKQEEEYTTFVTTPDLYILWSIAAKFLGNGNRYIEIENINGIHHMNMRPGMTLKIPKK